MEQEDPYQTQTPHSTSHPPEVQAQLTPILYMFPSLWNFCYNDGPQTTSNVLSWECDKATKISISGYFAIIHLPPSPEVRPGS